MTRGILATMAALAVLLGIGTASTPASAQAYAACAPGYYHAAGYCCPYGYGYAPAYYPPAYYSAPFFFPGIGFGFHSHFVDHHHAGFHGGGFHGGHH